MALWSTEIPSVDLALGPGDYCAYEPSSAVPYRRPKRSGSRLKVGRVFDDRASGVRSPRTMRSSCTARGVVSVSPSMVGVTSSAFCSSRRIVSAACSELEGALRSSLNHPAVQDQTDHIFLGQFRVASGVAIRLHLALGLADCDFAHRAAEQRGKRMRTPVRVSVCAACIS